MKGIIVFFLLSSFTVFGQTVYLPHEVEKQVEPTGGVLFLNQFINANLRAPFQSAIKGLNGKVYVKGIVEPDGSMTNHEIVKGIDSLCNQEVIRVLSLYKAWQPAILKGERVRQQFIYPIQFKIERRANFDSTTNTITHYFDKKFYMTSDLAQAEYRIVRKVNELGYINADVVYDQKQGKKWSNMGKVPFQRKEIWFKHAYVGNKIDSVRAYELSARDENLASYATEVTLLANGTVLSEKEFSSDNKLSRFREFDLNGLLRKLDTYADSSHTEILWHENGQMKSVVEYLLTKNFVSKGIIYVNSWEKDGTQKVKEGDGFWHWQGSELGGKSYIEEGQVAGGQKEGKWVGKWSDGKIDYEETYSGGALLEGVSYQDSIKRTYTQAIIQPEFKGGINNMYKLLAQNIRYPMEASRRGISGKVQLSFVICEDGSVCDYKVEKGIGFGLDDEALRVVKKMSGLWEPGVARGKKVRVKYNLPINFQVQ